MKYYISDCHFYNPQFLPWRNFSSIEEETRTMIARWNSRVTDEDEVYILGDFSQGTGEETNRLLRELKGVKTLCIGNHDEYLSDATFERSLFAEITQYKEIEDNGVRVILSHYPLPFYNGQYRHLSEPGALTYMLYGHLHCTYDETLLNHYLSWAKQQERNMQGVDQPVLVECNMINCCCYLCGYMPFTLQEWKKIDQERRKRLEEHPREAIRTSLK